MITLLILVIVTIMTATDVVERQMLLSDTFYHHSTAPSACRWRRDNSAEATAQVVGQLQCL